MYNKDTSCPKGIVCVCVCFCHSPVTDGTCHRVRVKSHRVYPGGFAARICFDEMKRQKEIVLPLTQQTHTHALQHTLCSCKFGSWWQTEVLYDRSENQLRSTCWWFTMMNSFVAERERQWRKSRTTVICWSNCEFLSNTKQQLSHASHPMLTPYLLHTHTHTQLWHYAHPSSVWGIVGYLKCTVR